MRNVRPFNEEWTEEPLTLQEVLDEPGAVVCEDCGKRGIVQVRGPESYWPYYKSEACETCHGWGAVRPRTAVVHVASVGPGDLDVEYVDRRTEFGNPYAVGVHGTREEVIERFREHLLSRPELMRRARERLRGRRLACHCAPEACHADVLAWLCDLPEAEFEALL